MAISDYLFIILYFIGLLVLGGTIGKRTKSSREMFIAGKNSSWWLSGMSTYMTIFSAGTFVIWGGVAYRSGFVAITVALMLGVSSILVGRFIAGKWSKMKIDSPAEYLKIRFGPPAVRFYSIVLLLGRGVHSAIALYAVAVMVVVLIPLPEGNIFADPHTGLMSIKWTILIMGVVTFIYTSAGGFIAVLITDLVQFAVLMAMIIILVPLSINSVGGVGEFFSKLPEGFLSPVSSKYSWLWMILWCLLNFFMIAGDWTFVQRFISVPTAMDAKKSVYFVGILYLITPFLWYVPVMAYRTIDPLANPEHAYMLMSKHILGPGMIGLMLAAMISATLSMVSSTLNVFANVFTYDIFKTFRPLASDKKLMKVGRRFTFIYGLTITVIAILIPYIGGAEKVVVSLLTLFVMPLFIPSIWGLFSKRIGQKAVLWSMGITYLVAFLIKTELIFVDLVINHIEFVDAFVGFVFPVTILLIIELILHRKEKDSGWDRLVGLLLDEKEFEDESNKVNNMEAGRMYSHMAFKILTGVFMIIGLIMMIISLFEDGDKKSILLYGVIFFGVSLIALLLFYLYNKKNTINNRRKVS